MPIDRSIYDAALHQYREQSAPNPARLAFERWLVIRGRSEHAAAGPPSGEYAEEALGAFATYVASLNTPCRL